VWKLAFTNDVEKPLLAECAYVEGRLKIGAGGSRLPLAERVYRIYALLLAREEDQLGLSADPQARFAERQAAVIASLSLELQRLLDTGNADDPGELLRLARRRLRDCKSLGPDAIKAVKSPADALARVMRIGSFAFANETVTQEELAEHLKRLRNDYCFGSPRDTLNRFLPQPAGPRRAHVRVPEPLGLHQFAGTVDEALAVIRGRMQAALDAINATLRNQVARPTYPNPFRRRDLSA
jgi:hypothetical protein